MNSLTILLIHHENTCNYIDDSINNSIYFLFRNNQLIQIINQFITRYKNILFIF